MQYRRVQIQSIASVVLIHRHWSYVGSLTCTAPLRRPLNLFWRISSEMRDVAVFLFKLPEVSMSHFYGVRFPIESLKYYARKLSQSTNLCIFGIERTIH
jgi:hypothetical protein